MHLILVDADGDPGGGEQTHGFALQARLGQGVPGDGAPSPVGARQHGDEGEPNRGNCKEQGGPGPSGRGKCHRMSLYRRATGQHDRTAATFRYEGANVQWSWNDLAAPMGS